MTAMALDLFSLVISLVLLYFGAEWLIRGAAQIAVHFGVRPLVVGLVIVGFGTSMPEVVVSSLASFHGHSETALGNVIGSNIANSGLILASATLVRPMQCDLGLLRREGPLLVVLTCLVWAIAFTGSYSRLFGAVAVLGLVVFVLLTLYWARRQGAKLEHEFREFEKAEAISTKAAILPQIGLVFVGIVLLMGGGQLLVNAAVAIARRLGVSELVIAMTMISVGTSVPELATSIVAALRRQGDISIGNIIGSNIFNLLGVLGLSALIRPIDVPSRIRSFDLPWMVGFAVLTVIFLRTGRRLSRWEGAILLGVYGAFLLTIAGIRL